MDEELINIEERIVDVKNKLIEMKAEAMEENAKEGNLEDEIARTNAEAMFKENCKHELLQRRESVLPGTKSLKQVLEFVRFNEFMEQSLANEMAMTLEGARQAIMEYVKFIYLMQYSHASITPSDEVDLVWHFHMTHTKMYHLMGKEIFDRFIHHNPTEGGEQESKKYNEWYNYTLYLYEKVLGEKPPARFWPKAERRFSHDYTKQAWVDIHKLLVIS